MNEQPTSELVTVHLSTLIGMAGSAKRLSLRQNKISSRQSGGYVSHFKGRGMEFDESRLYQPGDDIRCIDWRVTARSGKTHTKIFREERERPIFISVDYRRTMSFATRGVFKSVQAAKLAALIAWAGQQQGDRIGGQIFADEGCLELKPIGGKHGVLRLFNALVNPSYSCRSAVAIDRVWARLVEHAKPGSRVYLISDFRGLSETAEKYLRKLSRHCEVVLIMVYDPLEKSLPKKGRYRFTDETRDVVVDTGDQQLVAQYQSRFQRHFEAVTLLGKKMGMAFLECHTAQEPVEIFR